MNWINKNRIIKTPIVLTTNNSTELFFSLKVKNAGIVNKLIIKINGNAIRPKPIGPKPVKTFFILIGIKYNRLQASIKNAIYLFIIFNLTFNYFLAFPLLNFTFSIISIFLGCLFS